MNRSATAVYHRINKPQWSHAVILGRYPAWTNLMKFVAGVFAIFGLAFHVRVYKIVAEPVVSNMIESANGTESSISQLLLILITPWIPILFYSACFVYCFARRRNWITVGIGLAIIIVSVPYFISLFQLSDTSRIICLFAGGSAIYNHMTIFPPKKSDGLLCRDGAET